MKYRYNNGVTSKTPKYLTWLAHAVASIFFTYMHFFLNLFFQSKCADLQFLNYYNSIYAQFYWW